MSNDALPRDSFTREGLSPRGFVGFPVQGIDYDQVPRQPGVYVLR